MLFLTSVWYIIMKLRFQLPNSKLYLHELGDYICRSFWSYSSSRVSIRLHYLFSNCWLGTFIITLRIKNQFSSLIHENVRHNRVIPQHRSITVTSSLQIRQLQRLHPSRYGNKTRTTGNTANSSLQIR